MLQKLKSGVGVLDFKFDFAPLTNGEDGADSDYLESGETISSYVITADTGITVDSDSLTDTNTSVTVWLSGGTIGQKYRINCAIVTSDGREDERTMIIKVVKR